MSETENRKGDQAMKVLKTYHVVADGEPCAIGQSEAARFLVKETKGVWEEVWERRDYMDNNRYHCTLFGDTNCWRDFHREEIVQPVKFVETLQKLKDRICTQDAIAIPATDPLAYAEVIRDLHSTEGAEP